MNATVQTSAVSVPPAPRNEEELEDALSRPTPGLLRDFASITGDILILGAGGKMGPTLARMARRALDESGNKGPRVLAVARFSDASQRERLREFGVETVRADLSDREQVAGLPDAPNIVYMAGFKFGSSDAPEMTWLMNTYVPGIVAERYAPIRPRMVVFSTGCVYPNTPIDSGGANEEDALEPLGEYANSCIGRERMFEYFAKKYDAPLLNYRLSYAIDLRYGVLVDVATKVLAGEPVDVTMGYANVIWQGDANAQALQCLLHAAMPPVALNVTGPETVSIREAALQFGKLFGKEARIVGEEDPTALLINSSRATNLFGPPTVPIDNLIHWVAEWLQHGGRLLNKPTHFEVRDGRY